MFECPECRSRHDDPSDAVVGFRIVCLDCAIAVEFEVVRARIEFLSAA